ncbi:MAG: hypothetical protein ACKO9A_09985, partial [Alphaproteobacteria bacterium]
MNNIVDVADKVARKDRGAEVPAALRENDDAQAFYGLLKGKLCNHDGQEISSAESADIALKVIDIITRHHIVDVWTNEVAQ